MYQHGNHFENQGLHGVGFVQLPLIQCDKSKIVIKRYVIPIIWKGDITKTIGFARWKKHSKKLADHPYRFDLYINKGRLKDLEHRHVVPMYHLYPVWRWDFPNMSQWAGVISLQDHPAEGEPIKNLNGQLPQIEREQLKRRRLYTKNIMQHTMDDAVREVILKSDKNGRYKVLTSDEYRLRFVPKAKPADGAARPHDGAADDNVLPPKDGDDVAGERGGVEENQ